MKNKIAIIGLGYVGLPLFLELSKKHQTIGYDIDKSRILTLKRSKRKGWNDMRSIVRSGEES